MMKKRKILFFSFLLYLFAFNLKGVMAEETIKFFNYEHNSFQAGENVSRKVINNSSLESDSSTLNYSKFFSMDQAFDSLPRLVGDYTLYQLEKAQTTFYINQVPTSETSFVLVVGSRVIEKVIQFEPVGYRYYRMYKDMDEEAIFKQKNDFLNYYTKEAQIGASIEYRIAVTQLNKHCIIPKSNNKFSIEFDGSRNEDRDQFKKVFYKLLWEYRNCANSIIGYTLSPYLKEYSFVNNNKNLQEAVSRVSFFKKTMGWAKGLLKGKMQREMTNAEKKKEKEDINQIVENFFSSLNKYGEIYLDRKNKKAPDISGTPQVYLAETYPLPKGSIFKQFYMTVPKEDYAKILPELEKMAEKYTVEVYKKTIPGTPWTTCRIEVYPNEREGCYQIIANYDMTWVSAEGADDSLEGALSKAFLKLQEKL
jgi:hypothetical protein